MLLPVTGLWTLGRGGTEGGSNGVEARNGERVDYVAWQGVDDEAIEYHRHFTDLLRLAAGIWKTIPSEVKKTI